MTIPKTYSDADGSTNNNDGQTKVERTKRDKDAKKKLEKKKKLETKESKMKKKKKSEKKKSEKKKSEKKKLKKKKSEKEMKENVNDDGESLAMKLDENNEKQNAITKKKKKKKRKREDTSTSDETVTNGKRQLEMDGMDEMKEDEEETKQTLKKKKKKKKQNEEEHDAMTTVQPKNAQTSSSSSSSLPFEHKYILAPMVGASELAFRLLCRKYGTQLAYTPMMSSKLFSTSLEYRTTEFQTIPEDRPLVCHFSANDPHDFAKAAQLVEGRCDAIDLNLGCPQRTAYVGHFGSYLLGPEDRELVLSIVRAGVEATGGRLPVFCKIRLLDTVEDTIELCRQLVEAGASLIAIHARYRASFERKGPGARDGPALLDQVLEVRRALPDGFPLVANGNVIEYKDVVENLRFTKADGCMSAEGILDNPALFLPRFGEDGNVMVDVATPSQLPGVTLSSTSSSSSSMLDPISKRKRKLAKKLREIQAIEDKLRMNGNDAATGTKDNAVCQEQMKKLAMKQTIEKELKELETNSSQSQAHSNDTTTPTNKNTHTNHPTTQNISLAKLNQTASDKLQLATEYLTLAKQYPVKIRSVVFHTRRMCKDLLHQYQLMQDCISSQTINDVQTILTKLSHYRSNPSSFTYDRAKAQQEKEALEQKKREEGKRSAYEARMIRKAKREGRSDREYYLRQGAEVPTVEFVGRLRTCGLDVQREEWRRGNHSQHCMAFHLMEGGCARDRACAFLHVEARGGNSFVESDEVAG